MVANEKLAPEEQGKDYIYAKNEEGKPYVPAWHTWNFKVMYPLGNTWSMSMGLENIANIRYRPYSSGITAPGRNLIVSARVRF